MKRVAECKARQFSASTEAKLDEVLWRLRTLYNAALEQRILVWRSRRKSISFYDQCKELTDLRVDDVAYRGLDCDMTRLTVLRRLDLAFKAFFRRIRAGERPGFPRFRGRERFQTLVFGTSGWSLRGRRLTLRGIGTLRLTSLPHRDGKALGLRLVRRASGWFAQFVLDVGETPAVRQSTNGVGIDVGLRTFATMSDGTAVEHPRFLRQSKERLKGLGRAVSSKRSGSVRRAKAAASCPSVERARTASRRTLPCSPTRP